GGLRTSIAGSQVPNSGRSRGGKKSALLSLRTSAKSADLPTWTWSVRRLRRFLREIAVGEHGYGAAYSSPNTPAEGTTTGVSAPRRPCRNLGWMAMLAPTLPLLASTLMLKLNKNDSPMRVIVKFWPMLCDCDKSNVDPNVVSHLGL